MSKIRMQAPEGVTHATIEGCLYEADEDGVITVINPGHVPILRRHGWADPSADASVLLGSSTVPAVVRVSGREVQLGELVAHAHERSGLSGNDWNALSERVRDRLLRLSFLEMEEAADFARDLDRGDEPPASEPDFVSMTKKQLVEWLKERGVEREEGLVKEALVAAARETFRQPKLV